MAGPEDGTWGRETTSLFGVNTGSGIAYHPAPLYEIAFLLAVSFALFHLAMVKPHWNRYRIFLLVYLLFRLGVDTLKTDPILAWNLTSIQWVCLIGCLGLLANHRRLKDAPALVARG
jgi:phosphatidylglycerol---prolipoprotein diacylglyceryl transferase